MEFGKIILIGGFWDLAGYILYFAIKKQWVPHYLMNVVAFRLCC